MSNEYGIDEDQLITLVTPDEQSIVIGSGEQQVLVAQLKHYDEGMNIVFRNGASAGGHATFKFGIVLNKDGLIRICGDRKTYIENGDIVILIIHFKSPVNGTDSRVTHSYVIKNGCFERKSFAITAITANDIEKHVTYEEQPDMPSVLGYIPWVNTWGLSPETDLVKRERCRLEGMSKPPVDNQP